MEATRESWLMVTFLNHIQIHRQQLSGKAPAGLPMLAFYVLTYAYFKSTL